MAQFVYLFLAYFLHVNRLNRVLQFINFTLEKFITALNIIAVILSYHLPYTTQRSDLLL